MNFRKGILVVLLLTALLFMFTPSPAYADAETWVYLAVGVAVFALIFGIYKVWEWDGYYDVKPGDIFVNIQTGLFSSQETKLFPGSQPAFKTDVNYNIDWLLTERKDGRTWVAAGFTLEQLFGPGQFSDPDFDCGTNLILGYRENSWDHKLIVQYFPYGGLQANAEIIHRF